MATTNSESANEPNAAAFEEILARLSSVVAQLEGGELPLERSLALFEEGVRLSRQGTARLDQAERRIEKLLGDSGDTEAWDEAAKESENP